MNPKPYFRRKSLSMTTNEKHPTDESPPILKSWNRLYTLVLVLHAIIIALFYYFTKTHS